MLEQLYPRPLSGETVVKLPHAEVPARSPLVGQTITLAQIFHHDRDDRAGYRFVSCLFEEAL